MGERFFAWSPAGPQGRPSSPSEPTGAETAPTPLRPEKRISNVPLKKNGTEVYVDERPPCDLPSASDLAGLKRAATAMIVAAYRACGYFAAAWVIPAEDKALSR